MVATGFSVPDGGQLCFSKIGVECRSYHQWILNAVSGLRTKAQLAVNGRWGCIKFYNSLYEVDYVAPCTDARMPKAFGAADSSRGALSVPVPQLSSYNLNPSAYRSPKTICLLPKCWRRILVTFARASSPQRPTQQRIQ